MNLREWALPVYTILMQLATGTLFVLWVIRANNQRRLDRGAMDRILRRPVLVIFFTILVAIIGSHFHLSKPLLSFLAIKNLRYSWLSREVLFTVLMFFIYAALVDQILKQEDRHPRLKTLLGWACGLLGSASIYCMSRLYLLPTQAPWNHWTTITMFFGSALLLGATAAAALLVMDAIFAKEYEPELADARQVVISQSYGFLACLTAFALVIIISLNAIQIYITSTGDELVQTSLSLLLGVYQPLLGVRFAVLFASVGIFSLTTFGLIKKRKNLAELVTPIYLACLLALVSEILGRFLFYASHVRLGI